jgi:hypothetical protein
MDTYEEEFRNYLLMDLPAEVLNESRVDRRWHILKEYKNPINNVQELVHLSSAMLAICSVPHSNADAERIFSIVRKNYNEARCSMKAETLSNLLVAKINCTSEMPLSKGLLDKCKRATREMLEN